MTAEVLEEREDSRGQIKVLWGKDASVSYAHIGECLGMTEGAVGVAMHRLRQRYRERLRAEVAHTVAEPGEVDDELRYLLAVVSG